MADIETITVNELDITDGATLNAEDNLLVEKKDTGKIQRVHFSGLFSQEATARETQDATLQNQINTMAGLAADGTTFRVNEKMDQRLKGAANGVAELDENGKIPMSQIPGAVNDVVPCYGVVTKDSLGNVTDIQVYEDAEHTIPVIAEDSSIIYLDVGDTDSYHYQYMWGKTAWAMANATVVIGESATNAYRGDRGKIAYDHSQARGTGTVTENNPHGLSKSDIGLGDVPNVSTDNQTPTFTEAENDENIESGNTLSVILGKIKRIISSVLAHIADRTNPHRVTQAQVGLSDVTNVATTNTIASSDDRNITSGAVYEAMSDFDAAKQNKTLSTPINVDGVPQTTVEALLTALNEKKLLKTTVMPAAPAAGDTVLYLGTETDYSKGTIYQYNGNSWKIISGAGGGGTVAHFATMSEWESARLITEGNDGYLANNSLIVIDTTNFIYIQSGTGSAATLTAIESTVIEYVTELPVSPAIKDIIYALNNNFQWEFYAGRKSTQTLQKIGLFDYNELNNKPEINDVPLQGSKTGLEYGLVDRNEFIAARRNEVYSPLLPRSVIQYDGVIYLSSISSNVGTRTSVDGVTFERNTSIPATTYVTSFIVFKGSLYAATSSKGLFKLTNGNFQQVSAFSSSESIMTLGVFNGKLYAGVSNKGLYISSDGVTFEHNSDISNGTIYQYVKFDNKLYITSDSKVYESGDGVSFIQRSISKSNLQSISMAVFQKNLYVGSNQGLFVSKNGFEFELANTLKPIYGLKAYKGLLYILTARDLYTSPTGTVCRKINNFDNFNEELRDNTFEIDGDLYIGSRSVYEISYQLPRVFTGTQAEWDALTTAEKNEYSQANITDSNSTVFVPVDTIADGNMNPVTSNAVYDKFAEVGTKLTFTIGAWTVRASSTDTKTIGTLTAGTWLVYIQSLGYRVALYASVGGNKVTTSSRYVDNECNGIGFGVVNVSTTSSITATAVALPDHDYSINADSEYHNITAIRIA